MVRFFIGLIVGVILGAVAVLAFVFMGIGNTAARIPVAAPSGTPAVRLSVDEAYLNQRMADALQSQPQFAKAEPQVDLRAPNMADVTASIDAVMGGNTLRIRPTARIQFAVEGGRIRAHITDINVGPVVVPRSVIQDQIAQVEGMVETEANDAVAGALSGTGLKVVNVTATETDLVVDLSP
jgi:hypothetical protein